MKTTHKAKDSVTDSNFHISNTENKFKSKKSSRNIKFSFFSFLLLLFLFASCTKDDTSSPIKVNIPALSAYRGDTITFSASNFDTTRAEVYLDGIEGRTKCKIIDVTSSEVTLLIPVIDINWNGRIIEDFIREGQTTVYLSVQYKDTEEQIAFEEVNLLFDPKVLEHTITGAISSGDMIRLQGRDLDINTLYIEFNSLPAEIKQHTSSEITLEVPDSCGNGYLRVRFYDPRFDNPIKEIYSTRYELNNYNLIARELKSISISDDGTTFHSFPVRMNSDNRITFYQFPNNWYEVTYSLFYNNENQLTHSVCMWNDEFHSIDSFSYSAGQILEKSFGLKDAFNNDDSLKLTAYTEYFLTEEENISEANYFEDDGTGVAFSFSRNYTYTESNKVSGSGFFKIYDNHNITAPLQAKIKGSYMNKPELDLLWFPGNLTFYQHTTYNDLLYDYDLYYDSHGNLIREECYSVQLMENGPAQTRELERITIWEY